MNWSRSEPVRVKAAALAEILERLERRLAEAVARD
jgi:hypothetical protein